MIEKSQRPLISFIIPCFNVEKYIIDCINSILIQNISSYEIICIDDGSTDTTKDKIMQFENSCIKYFFQDNKGVGSARNLGLKKATGLYISFIDADDFFFLEGIRNILFDAVNNDAETVLFDVKAVGENYTGICQEKCSYYGIKKNDTKLFISANEIWRMIYKNDFLRDNKIIFNENMKYGEDTLFSFFVYLFGNSERQYLSSSIVYGYRQRQNSVMHKTNKSVQHAKDMLIMMDTYKEVKNTSVFPPHINENIDMRIILCSAAITFDALLMRKKECYAYMNQLIERKCFPYRRFYYIFGSNRCLPNMIMYLCSNYFFFYFFRIALLFPRWYRLRH